MQNFMELFYFKIEQGFLEPLALCEMPFRAVTESFHMTKNYFEQLKVFL